MIKGEYYLVLHNNEEIYLEDNEYFYFEFWNNGGGIIHAYSMACEYLSKYNKHNQGGIHIVEGLSSRDKSKKFFPYRNITAIAILRKEE